jgi:hypothetical protein
MNIKEYSISDKFNGLGGVEMIDTINLHTYLKLIKIDKIKK